MAYSFHNCRTKTVLILASWKDVVIYACFCRWIAQSSDGKISPQRKRVVGKKIILMEKRDDLPVSEEDLRGCVRDGVEVCKHNCRRAYLVKTLADEEHCSVGILALTGM